MNTIALALIAVVLVALLWGGLKAAAVLSGLLRELTAEVARLADGPEVYFRQEIAGLRADVELLPTTWEKFKNESIRAESRARAVVRDARRELDSLGLESPAVEAAASELQLVDGGISPLQGVPAMPQGVEGNQPQAEGWRQDLMRKKFG